MAYITEDGKITTSCEDCAFVEMDDLKQTGCKAGRLEKFQEVPDLVRNIDDFFRIGRVCNLFRDINWLKSRKEEDYDSLTKAAKDESATRCDILILMDDDSTLDDLQKSAQSLNRNNLTPNSLIALLATRNIKPMDCRAVIQEIFGERTQWGAEQVVSPEISHLTSIDYTVKRVSTNFYSVSLAGFEYPPRYLDALNHLINEELRQIIMVLPDETGNGLLINRAVHEFLHGNTGGNIINKIINRAEATKCQNLILKLQDLSCLSSQL